MVTTHVLHPQDPPRQPRLLRRGRGSPRGPARPPTPYPLHRHLPRRPRHQVPPRPGGGLRHPRPPRRPLLPRRTRQGRPRLRLRGKKRRPLPLLRPLPAFPRRCEECGHRLQAYQTWSRSIVSLEGRTTVTVRVRCCRLHEQPRTVSPPALPLLIADHRVVAGDVLTAVGLLRWGLDLQRSEIQVLLAGRGIALSTGEISALSTEFLLRFFLLHHRRADRIRAHLQTLPGTVWLVDGTQDEGSEVVFVVQEGFSRIVLDADLLPNEGRTAVALVLQRNRSEFGVPDALLRDFSPEIREAARRVLPGVPQIGCHVHFGRNLGEHLFETTYGALRQAVLQTKVLTRLLDLRRRLLERTRESLLVRAFDHWARPAVEYLDEPRCHRSRDPMTLPYHACVARAFEVEDWCRRVVRALAARNTT